MKAIGGFFGLELPDAGEPYHRGALALSSGRACLRRILESLRPARVWAPFYVCDAVLPAIAHAGASVEFYAINDELEPLLPDGGLTGRDVVMYVNYFGVKNEAASALASTFGRRAVIDDTQAFFQRGYAGAWSFNSTRKFFGVPDGGYAYGESLNTTPAPNPGPIRYEHLVTQLLGDRERAFQQYRESESCVSDEPVAMSSFASRLLASLDYGRIRAARERNFARLHARLGSRNGLRIANSPPVAPYCYPLLLDRAVPWDELWGRKIFAPRLWTDVQERVNGSAFAWERQLASRVVPLPIDQRYNDADMDRVVDAVGEVMAW
jgi:hypothetical protein